WHELHIDSVGELYYACNENRLIEAKGFGAKTQQEIIKAIEFKIDDQHTVKIFTAPHFVATKLEAFKNRGKGDGRTSTDFEDIIYVLENRSKIWDEMIAADPELRSYLISEFNKLAQAEYLEEWIEGHVGFNSPPATYYLIDQWQKFANGSLG
ncbi:MAG: hypothetical protein EOP48_18995, partial [Sphingobacteriales bacterium]